MTHIAIGLNKRKKDECAQIHPYHTVTHCYSIGLTTNLIKCLSPWWLNMQAEQGYRARSYRKELVCLPLNSETKTTNRQTSAAI